MSEDDDGSAVPTPQVVEEVFTREGHLFEVEIGGRVLRTTPEHPFFVQGQGWTAAGELQPGNLVSTATGEWLPVQSITDTHQSVTVYNFRVSEYHTYFIAPSDLTFDVWVHNAYNVDRLKRLQELDVAPLSRFRGPNTKGDKLTGHELLQSAWLRHHIGAGRSSRLGGQNPAIALSEAKYHKLIGELQAEAGLHSPKIFGQQSARENILENVQILKEAGVPREDILTLLVETRRFIQKLGL